MWFMVVAPILGWIGVALSGSNTSTNAMFGAFQAEVGKLLGFPPLLLPSLNSVGAEIGKPIAPQTASVGVSTSRFVRDEGQIIRHNMGWTLILLVYLILIGVLFYFWAPGVMSATTSASGGSRDGARCGRRGADGRCVRRAYFGQKTATSAPFSRAAMSPALSAAALL